jgi:hypothetical protein
MGEGRDTFVEQVSPRLRAHIRDVNRRDQVVRIGTDQGDPALA